jgi:hypothetical protein
MADLTSVAKCKQWIGGIPNGEILSVAVSAEGSGYHAATTTLALSGVFGQGSDFSAVPVIVAGKIVNVVILDSGSLYLKDTPPTLVATDTDGSPGSGATFALAIAVIDSTADVLLARLVSNASAFFAQKCSRAALLSTSGIVETRDGHFGQHRIVTFESPVTAVASVMNDGTAVTASTGPLLPGYGFDADGVFLRGQTFADGLGNVVITYTAGYASNSSEAAMIEQAVTELVAQKYERRKHTDLASRGVNIAGGGQTTSFSTKDVPAEVQSAINFFQRPPVLG